MEEFPPHPAGPRAHWQPEFQTPPTPHETLDPGAPWDGGVPTSLHTRGGLSSSRALGEGPRQCGYCGEAHRGGSTRREDVTSGLRQRKRHGDSPPEGTSIPASLDSQGRKFGPGLCPAAPAPASPTGLYWPGGEGERPRLGRSRLGSVWSLPDAARRLPGECPQSAPWRAQCSARHPPPQPPTLPTLSHSSALRPGSSLGSRGSPFLPTTPLGPQLLP